MSIKVPKSQFPAFIFFSFVFAMLLVVGTIYGSKACDGAKPEYVYSSNLSVGDKAYVDIVSLSPKYAVSDYSSSIICLCKMKDGGTLWMYMSSSEYDKFEGSHKQYANLSSGNLYEYDDIWFSDPVRVHGRISNEEKLKIIGLEKKTNSNIIFVVDSIDPH